MTGRVEPGDYGVLLESVKREIAGSRVRAARAVNTELIGMYWRIGGLNRPDPWRHHREDRGVWTGCLLRVRCVT
jgi:hypothetical protein